MEIKDNMVLGTLCKHNHEYENTGMSVRYKKNRCCVVCMAEYHKKNKDKWSGYYAKYLKKNKDKIAERHAEYRKKNKDKIAERAAESRKKNKDKWSGYKAKYLEKNKEKIAERKAEYYKKNKDKIAEYKAEYRKKNSLEITAKEGIRKMGIFKSIYDVPPELIEQKKEQLEVYRLLNQLKKGVS